MIHKIYNTNCNNTLHDFVKKKKIKIHNRYCYYVCISISALVYPTVHMIAGSALLKEKRANGMLIFYFLQIRSGGEGGF